MNDILRPSERPEIGRKLGRAVGKSKRRALQLDIDRHVLAEPLPPIPDALDLSAPWAPLYLGHNDTIGDCGSAATANGLSVESKREKRLPAFEGDPLINDKIRDLYFKFTGGADTGVILLDWLDWLASQAQGFLGEKIGVPVAVNPGDWKQVTTAMALGYGLYIGGDVTYACVEAQPGSFWRTDSGDQTIDGGHCLYALGYDLAGSFGQPNISLASWGEKYYCTWEWWVSKVDEAYILVDLNRPSTCFDLATLGADIAVMQAAGQ